MQTQTRTKGTVLIVEDSPDIVDVLILTLSKAGFAVIYADSRDRALELLLLHNEPDVILLDVYMRGLTLDEFVKRARILYHDIVSS